jgi:hypothetical protein
MVVPLQEGFMDLEMKFKAGEDPQEMSDANKAKVAEYVQQRVGGMTCPDHHQLPTIIVSGTQLDDITFRVEGCCQKIIYLVKSKLAE